MGSMRGYCGGVADTPWLDWSFLSRSAEECGVDIFVLFTFGGVKFESQMLFVDEFVRRYDLNAYKRT